jgi:hypothetical protein
VAADVWQLKRSWQPKRWSASSDRVEAGVALARLEDVVAGSWIETGTPCQSEQQETNEHTTHEAPSIERVGCRPQL